MYNDKNQRMPPYVWVGRESGWDEGVADLCITNESEGIRYQISPGQGDKKDTHPDFQLNDEVSKKGGDYRFDGIIVGVFTKLSGQVRYAVEDDRGVLHIYGPQNLVHKLPDLPDCLFLNPINTEDGDKIWELLYRENGVENKLTINRSVITQEQSFHLRQLAASGVFENSFKTEDNGHSIIPKAIL